MSALRRHPIEPACTVHCFAYYSEPHWHEPQLPLAPLLHGRVLHTVPSGISSVRLRSVVIASWCVKHRVQHRVQHSSQSQTPLSLVPQRCGVRGQTTIARCGGRQQAAPVWIASGESRGQRRAVCMRSARRGHEVQRQRVSTRLIGYPPRRAGLPWIPALPSQSAGVGLPWPSQDCRP